MKTLIALLLVPALAMSLAQITGALAAPQDQISPVAVATLTGTAYRLVNQTIADGVVIDETEVPVTDGHIAIPELGIDMPLAADGTFRLSDLPVSADPNNPTEVTVIFTAPGLASYTFTHLRLYPGTVGPNLTPQLNDTPRVDDLSRAHGDASSALPGTGGGGSVADSGPLLALALIALVGAAFICAGAAARYRRSVR